MAAKFQRAQASIIKSIRQVSLFREWLRLRGRNALPLIEDFSPDSRAGDADDLPDLIRGKIPEYFRFFQEKLFVLHGFASG